jgi:type VI secretion system protein ImpA
MAALDPNLTAGDRSDEVPAASDEVPAAADAAIPAKAAEADASALDAAAPVAAAAPAAPPPAAAAPAAAAPAAVELDPAVAALCAPLSEADPCGPDLDLKGDEEYLNFFMTAEGILPPSFFSTSPMDPGKPFFTAQDDQSINAREALPGQVEAIKPLLARTRDLRLLVMRARLLILSRDLGGFAQSLAAVAELLDRSWDAVHPSPPEGALDAKQSALAALDFPTVVFTLQYAPLFEAPKLQSVTYRAWMIASGEINARAGELKHPTNDITDAIADAKPAALTAARKNIALLKASLARIRNAFTVRGSSYGLQKLPALVESISAFIDPGAAAREQAGKEAAPDGSGADATTDGAVVRPAGAAPASLAQAKEALAAIAAYYSRSEPSSPTLPLVRQAHQLIGKSFIEVMTILVPTQIEKAAFQIGADQVFELPVGRLSNLSAPAPAGSVGQAEAATPPGDIGSVAYSVQSRSQAVALLDQVQRFFRGAEPSSPVPMLCERARALAERDFMAVLRDVLPKAALKNAGADK